MYNLQFLFNFVKSIFDKDVFGQLQVGDQKSFPKP